jgi:predicted aspartyl protease
MTVSFPFTRGRLIVLPVRVRCGARSRRPMMALDTGARFTLVTPELAIELGIAPDRFERATRLVGLTGPTFASALRLDSVSVSGLGVADLRVVCHPLPADFGIEGILGLDFLNRFRVLIDGPAETVTIDG